jgi:hypothetical protein
VASYLARARSTNEPETSKARAESLKHFLREIKAFQLDNGFDKTNKFDPEIKAFRIKFEHMLNTNPPPAVAPPGAKLGENGAMNPKAEYAGDG